MNNQWNFDHHKHYANDLMKKAERERIVREAEEAKKEDLRPLRRRRYR